MVENLFAPGNTFRHPVDRLVGVVFGKRATAPLEEARQIVSDFEVFLARSFAVPTERYEQPVESVLRERPLLARRRLNMVLPVEHSSVSGFEVRLLCNLCVTSASSASLR